MACRAISFSGSMESRTGKEGTTMKKTWMPVLIFIVLPTVTGSPFWAQTKSAEAASIITIPAGTRIAVRMIDSIDGKTARAGMRYQASIDDPVAVGSQMAIPKYAKCTVEVVAVKSGDEMALRLREVNLAGKAYSTSTDDATVEATGTSKGKSAAKRGIGLGALGAGIGAIAGGGSGAAIGAAVGGGVGAISAAGAKGKQLNVPTETRLLFSLTAPLPLN
jgi:hypothetical protein